MPILSPVHAWLWLAPLWTLPQEPEETLVSSPRSAQPATDTDADRVVVEAEELHATNERSLPRQLGKAAGVWIQETNLGGGSPLLQGLSGNQVLLVVDGVRMNDSTTRNGVNQMLNGIDPATVERIEVLRGPRSVLYGSDALGGVVLVWTKRRAPHGGVPGDPAGRIGGAAEARAETATEGLVGSLEVSGSSPRQGWLAVASAHDWDELHSAEGAVDDTGYHGEALFGSWEATLGAGRWLRLSSSITRDHDVPRTDRLNPGFGQTQPANSEFEFELQDRRRVVLAYGSELGSALADALETRLSFRSYDEQRHIRGFGSSTRRVEEDETNTLGLGLDLSKALGGAQLLTFGFDVDYDDVDSTRVDVDLGSGTATPNDGAFAPESRFLSSGLFVQDEILAFAPWAVTLGLRYGWFAFGFEDPASGADEDGEFAALSGSAAVARDLGGGAQVVGTLARGFRAPNLAELAREASFFGGTELPNPDLDPESSLYGELAFELTRSVWSGALAVFANRISDAVGSVLVDPGGPASGDETYLRENIATLRLYGAMARGRSRLGGPRSRWSAEASLEYTHGQQYSDFVDPGTGEMPFDDVPAQRIPPLFGHVALRYDAELAWLSWLALTSSWADEQDRLSPQDLSDPRVDQDGTDGWIAFDLDLEGPVGSGRSHSRWFLGVHNFLDADYRVHGSGIDSPGIGLVAGLRLVR